jgi:hypothetical protein
MKGISSVYVIIRSSGERTEYLCKKLILEQGIAEEKIQIIHEVPFSRALRKSYILGIESGCKWTYCIDADVLLRSNSIQKMLEIAEDQSDNVCEIQGFVLDKFFGGVRKAGNHLYRSSLLDKAIKCIPEEGINIRPERHTLGSMSQLGYKWKTVPIIVGLHDEEQYNFDIYRKALVHGVKHIDRLPLFVTLWKEKLKNDPDFEIAIVALAESIKSTDQLYIDAEQEIYSQKFTESGFQEKKVLDVENFDIQMIDAKIENWRSPDLYYSYFPTRDGYDSALTGFLKKMKRLSNKRGIRELVRSGINKLAK